MKYSILIQIIVSIAVIALAAQLSIELAVNDGMIPITFQTLAVLLTGYFLGSKWGTLAVALYVLLGLAGFPILADGNAGWSVLTGGSGGYLIGFIVGAFSCGKLKENSRSNSFLSATFNQTIGTIIILMFGVAWLSHLYGFTKALEYGFYPFWIGAIVKILLGAIIISLKDFLIKMKGQQ